MAYDFLYRNHLYEITVNMFFIESGLSHRQCINESIAPTSYIKYKIPGSGWVYWCAWMDYFIYPYTPLRRPSAVLKRTGLAKRRFPAKIGR